jgi:hypothetical protein
VDLGRLRSRFLALGAGACTVEPPGYGTGRQTSVEEDAAADDYDDQDEDCQ